MQLPSALVSCDCSVVALQAFVRELCDECLAD